MTVIARRICATPARSATEAWTVMIDLLAPASAAAARRELEAISGIAASLIADEAMRAPIVVSGSGPRVRLYCLYGDDAVSGEDVSESKLAFNATAGNWQMSLPCPAADVAWVQSALAVHSDRIKARDMAEAVDSDEDGKSVGSQAVPKVVVNQEGFFRA